MSTVSSLTYFKNKRACRASNRFYICLSLHNIVSTESTLIKPANCSTPSLVIIIPQTINKVFNRTKIISKTLQYCPKYKCLKAIMCTVASIKSAKMRQS